MTNDDFGKLLRVLRKQKKMTQEVLATMLDVSASAVCKWEKGNNLPDISMFKKISEIFDISLYDLHNPSETLARLENNTQKSISAENQTHMQAVPLNSDTIIQSTPENILPKKRNFISARHLLMIFPILILLILFILGTHTYLHSDNVTGESIRPIISRIVDDEYCGTVYEVAYVYNGNVDYLNATDPFMEQISSDWINNTVISSDITIMKVSFYAEKEQALQWSVPMHSTYFIR